MLTKTVFVMRNLSSLNGLILFLALIFPYSLSAQAGGISSGKYSYKTKDGLVHLTVKPASTAGIVAVDLERIMIGLPESKTDKKTRRPSTEFKNSDGTLHNAKGLVTDRDTGRPLLEFKNSDGVLHLVQLANEHQFKNKKGYLRFKSKNGTVSYKYLKGKLSLPGWDEGIAAVAINNKR